MRGFWSQIPLDDLRRARTRLVDRYILHSPFVDANPTLVRLVLDRAAASDGGGGGDAGRRAIARLLDERYAVDSALAAAHESLGLLRSVMKTNVAAANASTTHDGSISEASP